MQTAIAAILIFGLLIFVHEFGHFITAKLSGMRVEEFSIGMGPKFATWNRGETRYSLGVFPIGGYVRVTGESPEDDNEHDDLPEERRYQNRPIWQRFIFIAAGSFMNFMTAIVIFIIMFMMMGMPVLDEHADSTISVVVEDGAAYEAGLRSGDKIIQVNGQSVDEWIPLVEYITSSGGNEMQLVVLRGEEQFETTVNPRFNESNQQYLLGIQKNDSYTREPIGFVLATQMGLAQTYDTTLMMVDVVKDLFTGKINIMDDEEGLTGPVGIIQIIGESTKEGYLYILNLTALLSINLGLLNILPIPALDGSKLVFLLIEAVRGKPVDANKENFVHLIGFALLIALMIFVTYQDILRLFS